MSLSRKKIVDFIDFSGMSNDEQEKYINYIENILLKSDIGNEVIIKLIDEKIAQLDEKIVESELSKDNKKINVKISPQDIDDLIFKKMFEDARNGLVDRDALVKKIDERMAQLKEEQDNKN